MNFCHCVHRTNDWQINDMSYQWEWIEKKSDNVEQIKWFWACNQSTFISNCSLTWVILQLAKYPKNRNNLRRYLSAGKNLEGEGEEEDEVAVKIERIKQRVDSLIWSAISVAVSNFVFLFRSSRLVCISFNSRIFLWAIQRQVKC